MDPSEKERYEIQVRENCIQLAMHQFNDGKIPFNMAISRADSLSQFILHGINPDSHEPEPQNVCVKGKVVIQTSEPWVPPIAVFDDKEWVPTKYPLVGGDDRHFRIEQDGKGNILFKYEDGTKDIFPLTFFPEDAGK